MTQQDAQRADALGNRQANVVLAGFRAYTLIYETSHRGTGTNAERQCWEDQVNCRTVTNQSGSAEIEDKDVNEQERKPKRGNRNQHNRKCPHAVGCKPVGHDGQCSKRERNAHSANKRDQ